MNLDQLDEKICRMRAMNDRREIELNKLEAYYWLKTNFNIEAEKIKSIRYKERENKSFIEMRSDVDKNYQQLKKEYEQELIEIKGHVHNILMGLDTSYKKTPIWAELEKCLCSHMKKRKKKNIR